MLSKAGETLRAVLEKTEITNAMLSRGIYCLRIKAGLVSPLWLTYTLINNLIRNKLFKLVQRKRVFRQQLDDLRHFPIVLSTIDLAWKIGQREEQVPNPSLAAKELWISILEGMDAELCERLGILSYNASGFFGNIFASSSTNIPDDGLVCFFNKTYKRLKVTYLYQMVWIVDLIRKNVDAETFVQLVNALDINPHNFIFRTVRIGKCIGLPAHIRLPIQMYQVLLIALGSNLGSHKHLVGTTGYHLESCLVSNTFLVFELYETTLYFGRALKHPVVLAQIDRLAVREMVKAP